MKTRRLEQVSAWAGAICRQGAAPLQRTYAGRITSWGLFLGAITRIMDEQRRQDGRGLRLLTETVISPTLAYQLQQLLDRFRAAKWHQYEPVNRGNAW